MVLKSVVAYEGVDYLIDVSRADGQAIGSLFQDLRTGGWQIWRDRRDRDWTGSYGSQDEALKALQRAS